MSDELTPITRKETFLAKAGGQNVVTPTPITREETFLQAIIDNGGGGGGGGGAFVVHTTDEMPPALDKTWQEVFNALAQGSFVSILFTEDDEYGEEATQTRIKSAIKYDANSYGVVLDDGNNTDYIATSTDGYPVLNM